MVPDQISPPDHVEGGRLEKLLLGDTSGLGLTERRRRMLISLVICVVVPVILILDILSLFGQQSSEMFFDGVAIGILIGSLVLFRIMRNGISLYRLIGLLMGILLLFYLRGGGDDGSKVMWTFGYPITAFFLLGKREGLVWVGLFFVGAVTMIFTPGLMGMNRYAPQVQVRFLVSFGIISILSYSIESLRARFEQESNRSIRKLEKALTEVKTLKGLLPICASCKNVRDDKGYWKQIEEYLHDHSDAEFTHGICPSCIRKLYPEMADELLAGKDNEGR